jgi:serine/threonine protein kinase/WD40 repeat protein
MNAPELPNETLFESALKCRTPSERAAYLDQVCVGQPELRQRIDHLIEAHERSGGFLESAGAAGGRTLKLDSSPQEAPGTIIGRYKLLQQIGEGGMGVVYMAEQEAPVRRRVALKIIKLGMDTKQVVARFEAERQALAMMDHPNIARVLDGGATEAGRPYFVMELVQGIPITEFCDKNKLPAHERLKLFIQVCQAVQSAHQKGIIHRDLKPSNVLVTLHHGEPMPKVIDFGVAKATNQKLTEKTLFTNYATMIGTPAYMSPEQAEMSSMDVDTRTDVYALGVLLYELLTGTTPFPEKRLRSLGYGEMQRVIMEEEPERPSTRLSTMANEQKTAVARSHGEEFEALGKLLRGDLDWIVMKCLEKDRQRRYETANGLAADIQRHLANEPVIARPPSAAYRFQKAWRRNRVVFSAGATVVTALIAGLGLAGLGLREATVERDNALLARANEETQRKEAQRHQEEAETERRRAQALRDEALAAERRQRLNAYAADMSLAQRYLNENNLSAVKLLLNRYENQSNEMDVRGIFWTHLNEVSNGDESSHTFPHEAMVRGVSLSADGVLLASVTLSGKVRLYDVNTTNLLWRHGGGFLAYGADESSVALSPDGLLLASDQQGTLRVWNTRSKELAFEQAHVRAPLVFSPDSRWLAAVAESGLQLWATADWSPQGLVCPPADPDTSKAFALIFARDGKRLIFSQSPFASRLVIYNLETQTTEGELEGLDRPAVLSTAGSLVAAGGWGGRVAVWALSSRSMLKEFRAHNSIVLGVALSPDARTLATGGNDSVIKLWNTETFRLIRHLRGHRSQIWDLKFSSDGRYLASAGMDQSVKLWDLTSGPPSPPEAMTAGGVYEAGVKDERAQVRRAVVDTGPARGAPTARLVMPGESLQNVIDDAAPGDHVQLSAGLHLVENLIVVDKPLVLSGTESIVNGGVVPAILRGVEGIPNLIEIQTGSAEVTLLRDLQIESRATGIRHVSGSLVLQRCRVTVRSIQDFNAAVSLYAVGNGESLADTILVDACTLRVEDAGGTIEGTPPDIDVFLANSGARYEAISIQNSRIENQIPNAISNGIETRSTRARVILKGNEIRCRGFGILMPNHEGVIEIRNNTIWASYMGIQLSSDESEPSYIAGNRIAVEHPLLQFYPHFLRSYIPVDRRPTGISIAGNGAGITAGFFLRPVISSAANFRVEDNILTGNPNYGIAMTDPLEAEIFGPPTPNTSHDNVFTRNDFTGLQAEHDIVLGASTYNNRIYGNVGVRSVFKEAGDRDRNYIGDSTENGQ